MKRRPDVVSIIEIIFMLVVLCLVVQLWQASGFHIPLIDLLPYIVDWISFIVLRK